jgi:hypothetical protein
MKKHLADPDRLASSVINLGGILRQRQVLNTGTTLRQQHNQNRVKELSSFATAHLRFRHNLSHSSYIQDLPLQVT